MSGALTLKLEPIDALRADGLEDLLTAHFDEVEDLPAPMAPDWPRYYALERAGVLKVLALRQAEKLIGYSVWFVAPTLHHRSTTWAVCDILYVDPRARGRAGLALIRGAVPVLEGLGARVITYAVKPRKADLDDKQARDRVGHLLHRLGYSLAEESWALVL